MGENVYDIKERVLTFSGSTERHSTMPFTGRRWSMVAFSKPPDGSPPSPRAANQVYDARSSSDDEVLCDNDQVCDNDQACLKPSDENNPTPKEIRLQERVLNTVGKACCQTCCGSILTYDDGDDKREIFTCNHCGEKKKGEDSKGYCGNCKDVVFCSTCYASLLEQVEYRFPNAEQEPFEYDDKANGQGCQILSPRLSPQLPYPSQIKVANELLKMAKRQLEIQKIDPDKFTDMAVYFQLPNLNNLYEQTKERVNNWARDMGEFLNKGGDIHTSVHSAKKETSLSSREDPTRRMEYELHRDDDHKEGDRERERYSFMTQFGSGAGAEDFIYKNYFKKDENGEYIPGSNPVFDRLFERVTGEPHTLFTLIHDEAHWAAVSSFLFVLSACGSRLLISSLRSPPLFCRFWVRLQTTS